MGQSTPGPWWTCAWVGSHALMWNRSVLDLSKPDGGSTKDTTVDNFGMANQADVYHLHDLQESWHEGWYEGDPPTIDEMFDDGRGPVSVYSTPP